jgi:hypothetical protein
MLVAIGWEVARIGCIFSARIRTIDVICSKLPAGELDREAVAVIEVFECDR